MTPQTKPGIGPISRHRFDGDGESEALKVMIADRVQKLARSQASAVIGHVFCTVLGYSNVQLALIAFCIAHDIGGLNGESIETQARRLGVTKQALSKEVTWFRDVYDIEAALGTLKTNLARDHYREAQKARKRKKTSKNGNGKHFNFSN